MESHRIPPELRPVRLKASCDIQLQSAFREGQWTTVVTLARQRHKSLKDKYYVAVELAAKSRTENAADQKAGLIAVEEMVNHKDKITADDADTLDLYEFSCSELILDYSETIGVLRVRLVRANPKEINWGLRCFDACLWHRDWANAQLIAAMLDKNFTQDRRFLFHNILLTYLVSVYDHSPKQRTTFSMLARALADKAFNLRYQVQEGHTRSHRAIETDEELYIWLRIHSKYSEPEKLISLLSSPRSGIVSFLENGFTFSYHEALAVLESHEASDALLTQIGNTVLDTATARYKEAAAFISREMKEIERQKLNDEKAGKDPTEVAREEYLKLLGVKQQTRSSYSPTEVAYLNASRDFGLWKCMAKAAKRDENSKQALKQVQKRLDKLMRAWERADDVQVVYHGNLDTTKLSILFQRSFEHTENSKEKGSDAQTLVRHLVDYTLKHCKKTTLYNDLMVFVDTLTDSELKLFMDALGSGILEKESEAKTDDEEFKSLILVSLRLKIWYNCATCEDRGNIIYDKETEPGVTIKACGYCTEKPEFLHYKACCVKEIAKRALKVFSVSVGAGRLAERASVSFQDPLSELATIGASCLLTMAGIRPAGCNYRYKTPLYKANVQLLFGAVLWLDFCASKLDRNDSLRMLLFKLYLLIGCVPQAKMLWADFDVKNILENPLGSLILDRLSSISPGDFLVGTGHPNGDPTTSGRTAAEAAVNYFSKAIRVQIPTKIQTAFDHANYSTVEGHLKELSDLSSSCTMVVAVIEHRRGTRMKGGKNDDAIDDHPLVGRLTPDQELKDFTDYSRLPNFSGYGSTTTQELVSCGPPPSNVRCHLSLCAERFLDLVCYVQPKDYKATKAGLAFQNDWEYARLKSENIAQLMLSLIDTNQDHGSRNDRQSFLSGSETWYFTAVWKLAEIVKDVLENAIIVASSSESRDSIRRQIKAFPTHIKSQTSDFCDLPDGSHSKLITFHALTGLHAMGMLRETLLALKRTAGYLVGALERFKAENKSRGSAEAAWLLPLLKDMEVEVAGSEAQMAARIKQLHENLSGPGWLVRVREWAFGAHDHYNVHPEKRHSKEWDEELEAAIPAAFVEDWANQCAESWRSVMRGWKEVKWD